MRFELAPFALPAGYGEAILPLDDVKRFVGVEAEEEEFDLLLAVLRDASVQMVENYTGLILGPREDMVWRAEGRPARLRLGVRPVAADGVTAFAYLDGDGAEQDVDVATLRVGLGSEVLLKAGESWPSGMGTGLAVTFDAGLAAGEAPQQLVQAARMFTAHLFENREAVTSTGQMGGEIPLGFKVLCSPYRAALI